MWGLGFDRLNPENDAWAHTKARAARNNAFLRQATPLGLACSTPLQRRPHFGPCSTMQRAVVALALLLAVAAAHGGELQLAASSSSRELALVAGARCPL